jgi:SWI/SNF-related matrix-associated actin-dependent regulator 1 of chromatin subfamily A
MRLTKQGTYYVFQCSYGERDVPKRAGFRWDGERRQWWTPSLENAAKLAEYAEGDLRRILGPAYSQHRRLVDLSRAIEADIEIPVPEGEEPMAFQRAGVAYMVDNANTLLADEMGLGKTVQALLTINCLPQIKHVLVICPAHLRINWAREAEKWLVRPMTIGIVNAKKGWVDADFTVINYDIVHRHWQALRSKQWDALICDEAHYMKSSTARRTKFILGKRVKIAGFVMDIGPVPADRRMFLTGTPILNKPIELWPLVHALDPVHWNNWQYFTKRYCGAEKNEFGGTTFNGAENLEELQQKLRETVMVRRLKSQVLIDLPPKIRQIIDLPANGSTAKVRAELEAWERHEIKMEALRADVETAKSVNREAYNAAVAQLREGEKVGLSEISKLRHEVGLAKVSAVLEFLDNRSGKVVVFAHHRDVLEKIKAHFKESAVLLLYGGMSDKKKQAAIDRFQSDPTCEVFVGSIMAAGTGITLTAASHVVFAELDWTPATITQCEDRLHRIGQKKCVSVMHLVFDRSLDAKMARMLVEKQNIIDKALDT